MRLVLRIAIVPALASLLAVTACKGKTSRERGFFDPKPAMKTFRFDDQLVAARDACTKGATFAASKAVLESKLGPADEEADGVLHWYGSGRGAGAKGSECAATCCELALYPQGPSILAASWSKCP